MLSQYIDNLIQNIPKRETPYELDVVLEGGLFNGSKKCYAGVGK